MASANALQLVGGLCAVALTLAAARFLAGTPVRGLLDWAGRKSIVLLCLKNFAAGLVLSILLMTTLPPIAMVAGAVLGAFGGIWLVDRAFARARIGPWLGFPEEGRF
jgi:hypothetical protein